jgi:phospho-N-acetylmuramoyl-pentapeptide-transferase
MSLVLQRFISIYLLSPLGFTVVFGGISWFLSLATGKPLIDWLKQRQGMKWFPREDTPDSHLQKTGTPSMGGIGLIGSALIGYVAALFFIVVAPWLFRRIARPNLELLWMAMFPVLILLHAVLGYMDDFSKATNQGGLTSKAKLLGQVILAAVFMVVVYLAPTSYILGFGEVVTSKFHANLFSFWWLVLVSTLIIIGTSNAVNLTDGIDGLVAGLCVQVGMFFAVLNFGNFHVNSMVVYSVTFMWLCLGAACLGFLTFNKYPAKIFMGDTGSLALGAALGAGAVLTGTISLLPFIGFIFFIEMFSVIIQVTYFKYTKKKTGEGKRVFRRAPLHHHFEMGGWSEKRVVATFWAVNLLTSGIGLALWQMKILPRFP